MIETKTVHIISHSHWDREWYMPFEKFRIRLVKLIDDVMDLLETEDNGFSFFHLDGHVLLVDDYLEIRPEQEERVRKLVRSGKLNIGPWYVLQDAFLTSGEAQVRNMQMGIKRAMQLGGVTKVGYFPDTFGNISQSAQLLMGFEIETAVFGRGINSIAENNQVISQEGSGYHSELWWESPDGSKVLSVFLANWYHNGMELPAVRELAKEHGRLVLDNVEKYASTPQLLLMNGCDHQPVQADVGKAIQILNEGLPEYKFIHSHFEEYFNGLQGSEKQFRTVSGELISEFTDGWATLVNTASSRMYLKQWNTRIQNELERWVEPFAAIANLLGSEYPEAFVQHAWKLLLQNHPHDSICGCSIDSVHEEMVTRFKKVGQISEVLSGEALKFIADQIDTSGLVTPFSAENAQSVIIFNPLGWGRDEWVSAELDVEAEIDPNLFVLLDSQRAAVKFEWQDLGWIHGFTLPDDRFRIPWRKRRYKLFFYAEQVPALGYTTFYWTQTDRLQATKEPDVSCHITNGIGLLENAYLSMKVIANGSATLVDKESGHIYNDLLMLEDTGDIGNEYMYIAAEAAVPILSRAGTVVLEDQSTSGTARLSIKHQLELPIERDGKKRSLQTRIQEIEIVISLNADARRVEVTVNVNNQMKDHRLRVLFPTDLAADFVQADAPFDVVKRKIEPWGGWKNPTYNERMQSFFDLSDDTHGLMIVTDGLPEYEVLRDERKTMALTLLRCIGELGDWNYFPTPGAQCLGPYSCRFAIVPHLGDYRSAVRQPYEFNTPMRAVVTDIHKGALAPKRSWVSMSSSPAVIMTSLKKADTFEGLQLRLVNLSEETEVVTLEGEIFQNATAVSEILLNEKKIEFIECTDNKFQRILPKKKILSMGIE